MLRLMFLLKPGGGLVAFPPHISSAGEAGLCVDQVDFDTGRLPPHPRSVLLRPDNINHHINEHSAFASNQQRNLKS